MQAPLMKRAPATPARSRNIWTNVSNAVLAGSQLSGILSSRTGLPINVTLAPTGVNPATNQNYTFLNRNGDARQVQLAIRYQY
jgi:hypothetical protein